MSIKTISIDFWNTLYRHKYTAQRRKTIRDQLLFERSRLMGLKEPGFISKTFFSVVNNFINDRWKAGNNTNTNQIIEYCYKHYNGSCDREQIRTLISELNIIYSTVLKPVSIPYARNFVRFASRHFSIYLISDTYTIQSNTINRILEKDGILHCFKAAYYSDVTGKQKPDPHVSREILSNEEIKPKELIHIGDLLERDYEMCRNTGCYFIQFDYEGKLDKAINDELFLGRFTSFKEITKYLEERI